MNNTNNSLGFYIPNSDYVFNAKKIISREDYMFVITKENEVIVYKKTEDLVNKSTDLNKRFILFTHPQLRTDVHDILLMKTNTGLFKHPDRRIIVTISENLVINFWNINDGLCINKVNLSNYKRKGEKLLQIYNLNQRFLLFIFTNKTFLFDASTQLIFKEEKLSFVIKKIYKVKDTNFFLLTELNDTFILEVQNLPSISRTASIASEYNYEEIRFRIVKHTFHIEKVYNEETINTMFSKSDFLFYNINQSLRVSFLDSVEELSELSCFNTEYKFKIIFLDKIRISNEEYLIVIYKDLTCELFSYDRKIREIKKFRKFMIMIEDEFLNMKYTVLDSLLIGYVESHIHVFDFNKNNNIYEGEKYVDTTIDLKNIFGKTSKKLFFTNYFRENFPETCNHYLNSIDKAQVKVGKDYYKENENNNFDDASTNKTSEFLPSVTSPKFKVTASTIFSNPDNQSIYNIIGTNTGKVAMMDIFFNLSETNSISISPIILIDYHTSPITSLNVLNNKYLMIASEDGVISFTDISNNTIGQYFSAQPDQSRTIIDNFDFNNIKNVLNDSQNLNFYYSKRKSLNIANMLIQEHLNNNPTDFKAVNLLPIHTMKNYFKLNRILLITQLDNMSSISFEKRANNLLGFELEDNSVFILDMKDLKTLYRFNINSDKHPVKAIYHISYEKCLIFYLDDNIVKVCNYATKTADRIVNDINKIYNILRVEEKLKIYFVDHENILLNNFKVNYEYEEMRKEKKKEKENNYNNSPQKGENNQNENNGNSRSNENQNGISLEFIREILTNEKQKKLFMEKYIQNAFNKRKLNLNASLNKFESVWIKKIELFIIDEIFEILNSFSLVDKLKKISIMNLLFNPTTHYKIFDRYEFSTKGFEGNVLNVGHQLNEYLSLNIEDYLLYIERLIHEGKQDQTIKKHSSYYNFISIFHVWNLSIEQDINILNFLKIYQPIFEFNFILQGCDSSLSLILNEEAESEGDLQGHFKFFTEFLKSDEHTQKVMKADKFCNKSYLLKSQQGYLTNFKNHKFSTNLSHFLNLSFFGSLIAILGFEDSPEMCKLIATEKNLVRNLAAQKYTLYTNLNIIDKLLYEAIDNISLSNKDIILIDLLLIKSNTHSKSPVNDSEKYDKEAFTGKLNRIITYLENLYAYMFNFEDNSEVYLSFYKFHKEKNVEPFKMNFLTEFELSMINLIITFNSVSNEKDRLEETQMIKITELLVLFVFKNINSSCAHMKSNVSKIIVELLSKSTEYLERIYRENMTNYAKFLIDLYTVVKVPIDLEGHFKKYEIANCIIIKSDDHLNFLKIMLAKSLKTFSKNNISHILKIIVEEFKRKISEYDNFSYLLEILWILFREKNAKHVNYLPPLINLIMTTMSLHNKDLRSVCLDNAKKVLSCLLPNYPMISFHQNSQKLAVGANDGKVYIYDLTSGNIWKNLNAHTNEITALSFDFTGNILISYSSTEKTVKFWKIGLTNFFSNFFSMKDGYYKSLKFPNVADVSADEKINVVKFQLMPKHDNKVVLIREDKSVEVLPL